MSLIISRRAALPGAALAALMLAGCGSVVAGTAQPSGAAVGGATASAAPAPAAPGTGALIDCSFLTPAQVTALIGSSPPGRQESSATGDTAGGGCAWEDKETYNSVTIQVSGPDAAPGGRLPAWDPALGPERTLPGGMRDINGSVEFVCGGTRLCHVQVATASSGDGDQKKSLDLVGAVRAKVG